MIILERDRALIFRGNTVFLVLIGGIYAYIFQMVILVSERYLSVMVMERERIVVVELSALGES